MTWITLLYNNVQQKIVELMELENNEPVPGNFFPHLELNGEIDGYYVSGHRAEPCKWNKKRKEWQVCEHAPVDIKLTRMMLE